MLFVIDGVSRELTADLVRERLRDVQPARVRHDGVRVDGRLYPVKQAYEVVTGQPRNEFIAHTARQHFAGLGFEVIGDTGPRAAAEPAKTVDDAEQWHTEAGVQQRLIAHLVAEGWQISSVAGAQRREGTSDVVATRAGETVAIEVEGYPGRRPGDSPRAGERRPQPNVQAEHWFAHATLQSMRTRSRRPEAHAIIVLPDYPVYRALQDEIADSLTTCAIEIWWVTAEGQVL